MSSNLHWILLDNGFCVFFYSFVVLIIISKQFKTHSDDQFVTVQIFFDSMLILIHCYLLVSFKIAFNKLKEEEKSLKITEMTAYDYGKVIDEARKYLNEGYECPKTFRELKRLEDRSEEKTKATNYDPSDENIYEPLELKQDSIYVDVHDVAHEDDSNVYEEFKPKNDEYECINRLA